MFEQLTSTFPKRLDLWNVLIDQEAKHGNSEQVRRLFARVTGGKIKPRKAKYFFKKWLEYEERIGDPTHISKVKVLASEYVRALEEKSTAEKSA